MGIKHAFVSPAGAAGGTVVDGPDWNADHDLSAFLPTFIGCKIKETTAQSISDNAGVVAMTSNEEVFDTNGFHDTVTNNTRITIPTGLGGYYYFYAEVLAANDTTAGYIHIELRTDGTTQLGDVRVPRLTVGISTLVQASAFGSFTAGQYVELMVSQQAGNALDCTMRAFGCYLIGV